MIEPVELQDFLVAFFSAAMVIMAGALYALLFAWARLHRSRRVMLWAYTAYAMLVVAVAALADALHLNGFWFVIVITMLIGYFLAPHGIWYLCVGTHRDEVAHREAEVVAAGEINRGRNCS